MLCNKCHLKLYKKLYRQVPCKSETENVAEDVSIDDNDGDEIDDDELSSDDIFVP